MLILTYSLSYTHSEFRSWFSLQKISWWQLAYSLWLYSH